MKPAVKTCRKRFFAAWAAALFVPVLPALGIAAEPTTSRAAVMAERDELFMLAALAYVYITAADRSPPDYDIAALIAWDVNKLDRTPEFVIDRNRKFGGQGDIYHAETWAINTAYQRKWNTEAPETAPTSDHRNAHGRKLHNATLYTTLESCPMCATRITEAGIRRTVYCLEDPGLRNAGTHKLIVHTPTHFLGLNMVERRLPACSKMTELLWAAVGSQSPQSFPLTRYLEENRDTIFKPAYKALEVYEAKNPQNRDLVASIQSALRKLGNRTDPVIGGPPDGNGEGAGSKRMPPFPSDMVEWIHRSLPPQEKVP